VFITILQMENDPQHIWILIARKLAGEATALELEDLEGLLRDNPQVNYSKEILNDLWKSVPETDNQYAESRFKDLVVQMQSLGIDEGKFVDNDHFISNENKVEETVKSSKRRKILVFSSLLCVCLLAVVFNLIYSSKKNTSPAAALAKNEISTKNGSKTNLVLPDGTKVWLNAGSEMTYDKTYGNEEREVYLKGEAYFDVVKNAEKPFVIHTAKMDIKVLGTAFNVKCYPGEKTIETSLIRGSIEVTLKDRGEKIMLKPNEKLVLSTEENKKQEKANTNNPGKATDVERPIISLTHLTILPADSSVVETAWTNNRLIFISETFEDIALKMERWYSVKIVFKDEELKQIRITGTLEKETLSEAFSALQIANAPQAPFNYSIKNNIILISKHGKMKV